MATIASSSITFLDISDQQQLSAYLTSNLSTIQIRTINDTFNPSWVDTPLQITLHAFINQNEVDYSNVTIRWSVKDGSADATVISGQAGQILTVYRNELSSSTSGMLTYICDVTHGDANHVMAQMTFTLISEAKSEKAVVFSVYAPNGNVFVNQVGTLDIATNKYYGSSEISSGATFRWYKLISGQWNQIIGAEDEALTVYGKEVQNMMSFKCEMTYNGTTYSDVITLEDKSDIYISDIFAMGGNIFKNGNGGSAAYVIVRANGVVVDEPVGVISETEPSTPENGEYWYYIDELNENIVLKQYTGSSWVDVQEDPQNFLYVWYLMDKNGNRQDFDGGNANKRGKVIYMSCKDVNETATLCCEVEAKE